MITKKQIRDGIKGFKVKEGGGMVVGIVEVEFEDYIAEVELYDMYGLEINKDTLAEVIFTKEYYATRVWLEYRGWKEEVVGKVNSKYKRNFKVEDVDIDFTRTYEMSGDLYVDCVVKLIGVE